MIFMLSFGLLILGLSGIVVTKPILVLI